ncbi:MAG: O-acetyl-ADP-ribose deacetylase [Pleurocapsa sp.]
MSSFYLENKQIIVIKGNIVEQKVDAIVNAANNSLLGGGGVDGAIHRAAGTELLAECRQLRGCATGDAKITKGYKLSAQWIIHTVGPVWHGGSQGEAQLLASCYRRCLTIAREYQLKTLAFPAISTGVYSYPILEATQIAISEVTSFFKQSASLEQVTFVCFSDTVTNFYHQVLGDIN